MSLAAYKLLHVLGIAGLIAGIAAVALHAGIGGKKGENPLGTVVAVLHGLGLLLVLASGFGMLARIGLTGGLPAWVIGKVVIWLLLGAAIAIPYRRPALARWVLVTIPLLVTLAAYLAAYKPLE